MQRGYKEILLERDWQIVSDTEREYMSRPTNEEMALRSICKIRGQELYQTLSLNIPGVIRLYKNEPNLSNR